MMEPLAIRYRITEADFMTAWNAHWSSRREGTRTNCILGLIGLGLSAAMLAILFWLALVLAIASSLLLLITGLRTVLWRRAFRESKKYNRDIAVTVTDDSLRVESAEGTSNLNWDFFTWHRETPAHVLLYLTKRSFSIIPKASFRDDEGLKRFLALVESKLPALTYRHERGRTRRPATTADGR
ncbi:MAG: YcxB family protein [Verrucomicrobia bacterium]|nr:YcxB family protein [Verrucomicrobiota bacterium]